MITTGKKYRFGLVLGGGGVKGFAHIGVLRALDDFGLRPDIISAVSAGSIIGAFYASGMSPDEILEALKDVDMRSLIKLCVPKRGIFSLENLKQFLRQHLPERFEDLSIPLCVLATSLDTYDEVVFSEGLLAEHIVASCSLPVTFETAIIDGKTYIDGGVLHNLPAYCIREQCDVLLGVNVSPMNKSPFKSTLADVAYRSYRLLTTRNTIADMRLCDEMVVIDSLQKSGTFAMKKKMNNAADGYFAAMKVLVNSPILNQLRDEQQN